MTCRQSERMMLRARDGRLAAPDLESLEAHFRQCPQCRQLGEDYRSLFQALAPAGVPPHRTLAWEQLRTRIDEREAEALKPEYQRWALKLIPAAVALALLIGSASLLFSPRPTSEYTPSEELLLRNTNPLVEARTILEQKKLEDKSMMLIFASNEGGLSRRR